MYCTQCGVRLGEKYKFCLSCGSPRDDLDENDEAPEMNEEQTVQGLEDADADTEFTSDLADFVDKNQEVYMDKWSRGATWNWAAFFFDVYWMLYRKMYLYAFLCFLIVNAIAVMIFAVLVSIEEQLAVIAPFAVLFLYVVLKIVLGEIGSALYFRQAKHKISGIKSSQPQGLHKDAIAAAGGTNLGLPLFLAALPLIIVTISMALAIIYYTGIVRQQLEQL